MGCLLHVPNQGRAREELPPRYVPLTRIELGPFRPSAGALSAEPTAQLRGRERDRELENIDERETSTSCLLHAPYRGCARNQVRRERGWEAARGRSATATPFSARKAWGTLSGLAASPIGRRLHEAVFGDPCPPAVCGHAVLSPRDWLWSPGRDTGHVTPSSFSPSHRIVLSRAGVLQIRNPTRREQGLYGCSVANQLGSDEGSSPVLFAGQCMKFVHWGVGGVLSPACTLSNLGPLRRCLTASLGRSPTGQSDIPLTFRDCWLPTSRLPASLITS
ncbi:hypothetical protein QTO34_012631 [Cnephaeus nilssonii]|uniref:Ig-like domain-containing protein n=1 Tax=Cnephaeus nilssonii TaxID=3371016 RepID=A0AA40HBN5_CNENI|nr:hypothetical protein QTO34_012631 [Eptesicus nilssonii]